MTLRPIHTLALAVALGLGAATATYAAGTTLAPSAPTAAVVGSTDDDGTADQGSGDAPGTPGSTPTVLSSSTPTAPGSASSGDDDGTPDRGPGDAPGTPGGAPTSSPTSSPSASGSDDSGRDGGGDDGTAD